MPTAVAHLALLALVAQNTCCVILIKFSFRAGAPEYASSTVILLSETCKLALSSVFVLLERQSPLRMIANVRKRMLLFVPCLLYVVQQILLYYGMQRLPPVVFIVCTQTKILTTAAVSRLLLGTKLSRTQYFSLILLTFGVIMVQKIVDSASTQASQPTNSTFFGVIAVLIASTTSAFAGVILEKIYKGTSQDSDNNIWSRNIQLRFISSPVCALGIFLQGAGKSPAKSIAGFDFILWSIVVIQMAGGLITALVMKVANNILKCLAIAISICCCAAYSYFTNDLTLSLSFLGGVSCVIASVLMFAMSPAEQLPHILPSRKNFKVQPENKPPNTH